MNIVFDDEDMMICIGCGDIKTRCKDCDKEICPSCDCKGEWRDRDYCEDCDLEREQRANEWMEMERDAQAAYNADKSAEARAINATLRRNRR